MQSLCSFLFSHLRGEEASWSKLSFWDG